MLDEAGSLEEFQAMVLAAWPKLSEKALQEVMSTAFAALDLKGRADVIDETGQEAGDGR